MSDNKELLSESNEIGGDDSLNQSLDKIHINDNISHSSSHGNINTLNTDNNNSNNNNHPSNLSPSSSFSGEGSSSPSSTALKPNQVLLRIYFIDDTHKTLSIDPNRINGDQLWDLVSEKIGINNRDAECFFIWAQSDEIEWLLYNHQNISEVIDNWNVIKKRYVDNDVITPPTSPKSTGSSGSSSPSGSSGGTLKGKLTPTLGRKALGTLNFIGSLRKKDKQQQQPTSMSTTLALEHTSNKVHASFPTLGEAGMFRLVYKSTSVLPLSMEKNVTTPEAIHLLYIQAVHHVVKSNYPCEEDIAIKLASVQLQISVGDHKQPEHQEHFKESLENYIPQHLIPKHSPSEWEALVLPQHVLLRGSNTLQLKKGYLETCQRWLYYGCTFFKGKYIPSTTSFFTQEFEGKVNIGVNSYGFHIIDPRAMKVVSHHYKDIVCWDNTNNSFTIQFLVNANGKQTTQKTYIFKTSVGELINDLLHDWMDAEWTLQGLNNNGNNKK